MPPRTEPWLTSFEAYVAAGRVEGVAVAPGGARAALVLATLSDDRTRFVRSVWEVATDGSGAPRRVAARGSDPAYCGGGDLLYLSDQPIADGERDPASARQLWRLAAGGGEPVRLTSLPGGVEAIAANGRAADRVVVFAGLMGDGTLAEDARRRDERRRRGVRATLHEHYPPSWFDHRLGLEQTHLLALDLESGRAPEPGLPAGPRGSDAAARPAVDRGTRGLPELRDLSPRPGNSLDHASGALSPDGETLVVSLERPRERGGRAVIVAVDTRDGTQRALFDEPDRHFRVPTINHAGTMLAFVRAGEWSLGGPSVPELWVSALDGSAARRVGVGWDGLPIEPRPSDLAFTPADDALLVCADERGRTPVFRVPLDGGPVHRVTGDAGAYSALSVDAASGTVIALRSEVAVAPHPVRIDSDGAARALATPAAPLSSDARVRDITATSSDGTPIRGWLVLPSGDDAGTPAPLLLWIHGGPQESWSGWSWRWNPLLAAARGYAVLMPDPGLSTGYGAGMLRRGWGAWFREPYDDLMAITDAAQARDDIDPSRTAALGSSYGGHMASWIAGHTDRFRAIVIHAGGWSLPEHAATTDDADWWSRIFTAEQLQESSPHHSAPSVRTPTLSIHGEQDHRVPVNHSLHRFSDLSAHHAGPDGTMTHRLLLFPDEGHWIRAPQNIVVWHETIFAFLDEHVRGLAWRAPDLLG